MYNITLTDEQRDELINHYCEIVVDSMDMKSLMIYAIEQMSNYMDKLSLSDIKEDIDNYDSDLFDELVDNVGGKLQWLIQHIQRKILNKM